MQSQLQAVARGFRLRRQRELFEHIEILGALQLINELHDAGIIACHGHIHINLRQTLLLEIRFPERLPLGFQTRFLREYARSVRMLEYPSDTGCSAFSKSSHCLATSG